MPSGKDLSERIPQIRGLQRGRKGTSPDLTGRNYLHEEELVDFDKLKKKLSIFRIASCKAKGCGRDIPKDPKIDFCSANCANKEK